MSVGVGVGVVVVIIVIIVVVALICCLRGSREVPGSLRRE